MITIFKSVDEFNKVQGVCPNIRSETDCMIVGSLFERGNLMWLNQDIITLKL